MASKYAGDVCGAELKVMNLKLRPRSKESVVNSRHTAKKIIESKYPDLIFLQEISAPESELQKLKLQDRYTYKYEKGKALGLMWRSDSFELVEEWTIEKKTIARNALGERNTDLSEIPTRTCVVLLKHILSDYQLLVICWYGPNKNTEKALVFTGLLHFAREIQTMNSEGQLPPIVIGGSFNHQLESGGLGKEFGFRPCKSSDCRRGDNYYFLYSGDVTVEDVQTLELNKNSPIYCQLEDMTQDQLYALDHDPLEGRLVFKQMKSGQKANVLTSGNDKPPKDQDRLDLSCKPKDLDNMTSEKLQNRPLQSVSDKPEDLDKMTSEELQKILLKEHIMQVREERTLLQLKTEQIQMKIENLKVRR